MGDEGRHNSESTDTSGDTVLTDLSNSSNSDQNRRQPANNVNFPTHYSQAPSTYDAQQQQLDEHQELIRCQHATSQSKKSWCRRNEKFIIVVVISVALSSLICISLNVWIINIRLSSERTNKNLENSNTGSVTDDKKEGFCFQCPYLRAYINKWAWQGVKEDRLIDECCFPDELSLLRTLKFYIDVEISSLKNGLHIAQQKIEEVRTFQYNLCAQPISNCTNETLASRVVPLIPPGYKKEEENSTLKKRSVVYFKNEMIHQTGNVWSIRWSTDEWMGQVQQGGLALIHNNSRIHVSEAGIYSIRVQIRFQCNVQQNKTTATRFIVFKVNKKTEGDVSSPIDTFSKSVVFDDARKDYDAILTTVARFHKGDVISLNFPPPEIDCRISREPGHHKISVIEES